MKCNNSANTGHPDQWKTRIATLMAALAMFLIIRPANADLLSRNFSITYQVSRNGFFLGDTVRRFRQLADGNWEYTATTQAKGLASMFFHDTVVETSILKQQGKQIIPLSYVYNQTGKDKEHYRIDFLWQQHKIHNSRLQKDYPIEGNAEDVQTFLLQIMRDLQQHQNTMTYFIASRSDATAYVLTQNGNHQIDTPYKSLDTVELVSNKLKDSDQYRVWCAVALEFMPVRIEKIDSDGNKIELIIKDFKLE